MNLEKWVTIVLLRGSKWLLAVTGTQCCWWVMDSDCHPENACCCKENSCFLFVVVYGLQTVCLDRGKRQCTCSTTQISFYHINKRGLCFCHPSSLVCSRSSEKLLLVLNQISSATREDFSSQCTGWETFGLCFGTDKGQSSVTAGKLPCSS